MKKRTLPCWWMKKRAVKGSGCSIPFVLICIFGGAPTEITAQEPLPFYPGVRVRVTAPDCGLRGRATEFRALRAETLVLDTTECPLASVTRLDVSRGRKSWVGLGIFIGVPAGALGAVVYCKTLDVSGCKLFGDDLTGAVAIAFGALGFLAGGIVGHFVKTELWEEVPVERLSVSLAPQRDGGSALGFSVRF